MRIEEFCTYAPKSEIKAGEATTDGKYMFFTSSEDESKRYSEYQFDGEGIIMGTGGNATLHYYNGRYAVSTDCIVLIPDNRVRCKYLYYFFLANMPLLEAGFKGAGLKHTNKKYIGNIPVNTIPPINEQDRIIMIMDKICGIIRNRKKELAVFDDLIKARFVEMFGSIHEDRFLKCKLKDVAHIKHGFAFSGEYFSDEDNGVVLVTPGNFALGGGFQEIHNRYFTSNYSNEYVLHPGDLIVTMTDLSKKVDTLGYGAIVPASDKVYLHNQRIGLFDRLDENLNPVFVRWYMQTDEYRLEIVRTSTGSTVHHTSPDRILNSMIFLPPIELQNSFVAFAKQVDKSKVAVQKALDEAQLLFDSLMQKYFG